MKAARIILLALSALAAACDTGKSREEDKALLNKTREEIEALAKSHPCAPDSPCRLTGLGSKPCGGPWSYLIYPTSVDTVQLVNKVTQYNAAEAAYNMKWSVVSDCSVGLSPANVACVDGQCVGNP